MRNRKDSANSGASLALLLYEHGGQAQEFRYSEDSSLIHVSDLFNLCFRQVVLLKREGLRYSETIPTKTWMKFRMGRAIEEAIKALLAEKLDQVEATEVELVNTELGLIGRLDIRLKNGIPVEIKAKDPAVFRLTRRAPLRRDQFQLETYLWMDQVRFGKMLTVTWGEEKNPFREQIVSYNVKVGELVKKRMVELREAEHGGRLPDRACQNSDDPRAVLCPVRKVCFATEGKHAKTIGQTLGGL